MAAILIDEKADENLKCYYCRFIRSSKTDNQYNPIIHRCAALPEVIDDKYGYDILNGVSIYEGRDERCPLIFVDTKAIIKKFLEEK